MMPDSKLIADDHLDRSPRLHEIIRGIYRGDVLRVGQLAAAHQETEGVLNRLRRCCENMEPTKKEEAQFICDFEIALAWAPFPGDEGLSFRMAVSDNEFLLRITNSYRIYINVFPVLRAIDGGDWKGARAEFRQFRRLVTTAKRRNPLTGPM